MFGITEPPRSEGPIFLHLPLNSQEKYGAVPLPLNTMSTLHSPKIKNRLSQLHTERNQVNNRSGPLRQIDSRTRGKSHGSDLLNGAVEFWNALCRIL